MHDLLFDNQAHLRLRQLRMYAERLELDIEKYDSEMHDELYLQRVRDEIEAAGSPVCDPPRASSSTGDATMFRSDWSLLRARL